MAGGIREQAEIDALDAIGVDAVAGMAVYSGVLSDLSRVQMSDKEAVGFAKAISRTSLRLGGRSSDGTQD